MDGLKIGEIARRTGVTPKTVRFYDEIGLLPPTGRTAAGYRVYSEGQVARLIFIRKAVRVGLSLEEVRELLSLYDEGQPCCSHARETIQHKVNDLARRIEELSTLPDSLVQLLRVPVPPESNSKTICPLIEYGSEVVQVPESVNGAAFTRSRCR